MSKAAKLIILVLFLLLGVSAFFVLDTLNQKQNLEKVKMNLEEEAARSKTRESKFLEEAKRLQDQLKEAQDSRTKLQKDFDQINDQIKGLNTQVTELSSQRDDWKTRFDGLTKERDELTTKIQALQAHPSTMTSVIKETTAVSSTAAVAPLPPTGKEGDAYWAEILKDKISADVQLTNIKQELSSNAVSTEELKRKNTDLEEQMMNVKSEREELERKIKYGEDLANSLSLELARAKSDRKFINDQMDKFREENTALRFQIKNMTNTKLSLEKSIVRLNEDKTSVERRLTETEGVIQGKIDEIWNVKQSLDKRFPVRSEATRKDSKEVELAPIIVSAPAPTVAQDNGESKGGPSGFEGHVVSVNDGNNFVIIDVGEKTGIAVGDSLNVYRDAQYIAGLEVIQVRKEICAADIKQKGDKIRVGDSVR